MNRILIGLAAAAALIAPDAFGAAPCGCKNLPQMVQELNEQQFLQRLFSRWSVYMPLGIETIGDLVDHATVQFNDAFYGGSGAAGTASGGHAAFGTKFRDANCPIVQYLYDKKGRPLKNKDGTQKTVPVSEKTLQTKDCASIVDYLFAHERSHQATCKNLVKQGKTALWDNPEFYAADDAKAYQAGIDVLSKEIASLAGKCGWNSSSKNRLPDLDQAKKLAKRAAKAVHPRRRK
jgi:hypothetical protein